MLLEDRGELIDAVRDDIDFELSSGPTTEPAYEVADCRKRAKINRESTGTPESTLLRRASRRRRSCISSMM